MHFKYNEQRTKGLSKLYPVLSLIVEYFPISIHPCRHSTKSTFGQIFMTHEIFQHNFILPWNFVCSIFSFFFYWRIEWLMNPDSVTYFIYFRPNKEAFFIADLFDIFINFVFLLTLEYFECSSHYSFHDLSHLYALLLSVAESFFFLLWLSIRKYNFYYEISLILSIQ